MNNEKTWIEVDQGKILNNFNQFCKRVGETVKIAAVVKANAYGHGLENMVSVLAKQTDFFCVDSLAEAHKVRTICRKPIIILGYTPIGNYKAVIKSGFEQTIFDFGNLKELNKVAAKSNKKALIHLEIETGTSRNGILVSDLKKYLELIKESNNLKLAGLFTHFANIEDTTNHTYAEKQLNTYKQAVEFVQGYGFGNFTKHTACSAASILFNETYFDMIRLGISLYGMWPSKETKLSAQNSDIKIKLTPALIWKTKIVHIKELPAKTYIGYGCTEKLGRKTKTAIIPIGYYDGFDRKLSNIGEVLVRGKRCRVLGRVCMNMTIIDVSNVNRVRIDDEVVLIGRQGCEEITAEVIAQKINTINYEVTTRINPYIKRIII